MPPAEVSSPRGNRNPVAQPRDLIAGEGFAVGPEHGDGQGPAALQQEIPVHRHRARRRVDLGDDMMLRGNDAIGISFEVPVFQFVFERVGSRPLDILIPIASATSTPGPGKATNWNTPSRPA